MGKKKKKRKPGKPYAGDNIYHDVYADANYTSGVEDDDWWSQVKTTNHQSYLKCHTGNTKVLSTSRGQGGSLFIGGWSRGAYHGDEMTVFDLTAGKAPLRHSGSFYQIFIDDFDVPQWSHFFWESLAMTVYHELTMGDVLIACQGGHGRSGMVTAVVSYLMRNKRHIRIPDRDMLIADPIEWIRENHCVHAVETISQERCVYETCLGDGENASIEKALEAVNSRPRYSKHYKPSSTYSEVVAEWVAEPDEEDIFLCPLCLSEYDTMVEALMCCSTTNSLRYCPVCLTKHELPVDAFNCCKVAPPIFFSDEEEEND